MAKKFLSEKIFILNIWYNIYYFVFAYLVDTFVDIFSENQLAHDDRSVHISLVNL